MRPLQDIALASGVLFPVGYPSINVLAASSDGSVVLGQAYGGIFDLVSFVPKVPIVAYGS